MNLPVVCLDLDRTVIYSPSALALTMPDHEAPRLLCVEVYQHRPLSFMTEPAVDAYFTLRTRAVVVPTTTRTPAQLARVHLPGPPSRYAIASNGGHLLVEGEIDADWTKKVQVALDGCAVLAEVEEYLRGRIADSFVESLRVASDLFLYAVVHRDKIPAGWLAELTEWVAAKGWATSLQGRKLYVLPGPLTKSAAAVEVMERCDGTVLLAAGDSLLDRELMEAADLAIRPAHGELHDGGYEAPYVRITERDGVLAGEEILHWMLDRIGELDKPDTA